MEKEAGQIDESAQPHLVSHSSDKLDSVLTLSIWMGGNMPWNMVLISLSCGCGFASGAWLKLDNTS